MEKDKKATGGSGQPTTGSTSTLKKSKRRNRNKKPSNVSADPPAKNSTTTSVKPAPSAPTAVPTPVVADKQPVNVQADLKQATAKVLEEVQRVIDQIIPNMERKPDEKDRDLVKAEREAKRLAKKNKKQGGSEAPEVKPTAIVEKTKVANAPPKVEKKATGAAKPKPQGPAKNIETPPASTPVIKKSNTDIELSAKLENLHLSENAPKAAADNATTKPPLSKAERRAIQEAQRAAKAKAQADKVVPQPVAKGGPAPSVKKLTEVPKAKEITTNRQKVSPAKKVVEMKHRVKLFSHLYLEKKSSKDLQQEIPDNSVHPAIIQLGVQQAKGTIKGANSRCIAFLNAMKMVISDFSTPPQKIFSRSLEALIQSSMVYLQKCRPVSVSMANALKAVKGQITHLPDNTTTSDEEHKETLCEFIDTYIRDQIEKAALAISKKVQEKIAKGDVILTYGCSSLIKHILEDAHRRTVDFRVIVVDSRPLHEGQEMLRRLVAEGIRCSCVLINAVSFVMPEVTKVLVGAHALLANGYVMSHIGTAQVAMVAKSYNVPVLVCCETHKFSERVQTDAFVYNEIGDPNDLVMDGGQMGGEEDVSLKGWETLSHLTPLHLHYDITPPELVAAVVTELAILPCTSVPVILRIRPTEVWY